MVDLSALATILPVGAIGTAAGFAGKAAMEWLKTRGERTAAKVTADVELEQHRDKLTFDLISASRSEVTAARAELAAARTEISTLRSMETLLAQAEVRLAHQDEALEHLEAVLTAPPGDERVAAERRARAFLTRMRRLASAHGTARNEAQRDASVAALAQEARDALDHTNWKD